MAVIARCNGTVLVEHGRHIGVVAQGKSWLGTSVFVLALLTLIAVVNGVVQLLLQPGVGAVILVGALAPGWFALRLLRLRKAQRAAPAAEVPWLIFDLEGRVLRDHAQTVLAPLDQVVVKQALQLASSSSALRVELPSGAIVIARGSPFGDSVDGMLEALRIRGIKTA